MARNNLVYALPRRPGIRPDTRRPTSYGHFRCRQMDVGCHLVCRRCSSHHNLSRLPQERPFPQTGYSSQETIAALTKACPKCGESIKFVAQKCRFCGEEFDPAQVNQVVSERLVLIPSGARASPHCGQPQLNTPDYLLAVPPARETTNRRLAWILTGYLNTRVILTLHIGDINNRLVMQG
jgi:predicted RNA-binding Zn-ribbon protein involved in translation (DUF1610 family)